MIQSPWAILLCKFQDDDSEPYGRQRYEDLFTGSGVGKLNMVDFFRDMSHGKLDLSGSEIFGWYTLDKNRSEYAGLGSRNDLINWARQKAIDDGVNLSRFFSVVVCMNVPTDLFGGGSGAVCDDGRDPDIGMSSMSPSLLGQEMGHAYGLDHSMAYGSTADYQDQWDVMSTAAALMTPHPNFTDIDMRGNRVFLMGPGLNAANMWGRGWLDESRVWSAGSRTQINTTVQLRPLHRRDLPGFLAIRFHEYFVEFRTNERWDAAVTPTVLVHRFEDNRSYLVSDSNGQKAFGVGSFMGTPENMSLFGSNIRIEVLEINADQQSARVRLVHTPADIPQYFEEDRSYRNPGVAWSGHNDALIVVDGKATLIPRRSLFFRTLEQIALYENTATIPSVQLQSAIRVEALSTMATVTQEQMQTLHAFRQPAPPHTKVSKDTQSASSDY